MPPLLERRAVPRLDDLLRSGSGGEKPRRVAILNALEDIDRQLRARSGNSRNE